MNSKLILAKDIKMDKDYNNVIDYSEANMLTLLRSSSHLIAEANNYSFIRVEGQLDTQFSYSQCLQANYIAFQNPDYSNKWFFAWVLDVEYRGNKNTRIYYKIDAWSTWFDYWTLKKCFVNRHHVNDDTIGLNKVPENLAINEVIEESHYDSALYAASYVIIESTYTPTASGTDFDGVTMVNKQIMGARLFAFPITNDMSVLSNFIRRVHEDRKTDSIQNMYIAPRCDIRKYV